MVKDTVLIFNDFSDPLGEFKAYKEYTQINGKVLEPLYFFTELGIVSKAVFKVH